MSLRSVYLPLHKGYCSRQGQSVFFFLSVRSSPRHWTAPYIGVKNIAIPSLSLLLLLLQLPQLLLLLLKLLLLLLLLLLLKLLHSSLK